MLPSSSHLCNGGSEGGGITQRKARVKKETQLGVDIQGKWLKKLGKIYYEYKKQIGLEKWNDTSNT
ncbi:MAG: hypothetical protein ACMUEL_01120 [Flavobacteriales bacterium Tduv]